MRTAIGSQAARVGEVVEPGGLAVELLEVERAQPLVQRAPEQHAREVDQALAAGSALTARDQLFELAQERVRGVAFAHALTLSGRATCVQGRRHDRGARERGLLARADREPHGDLGDAVGVPAHARQRRVEQARDRLVVEADDRDVRGDAQAELAAGGVDAERDRVREREDRGRPVGAGEQVARQRLRAVEAVLAGVQLRLEPEALPTTRARPARRCARASARSPTRARRCAGGRARRGARARRARRARGRTAPARPSPRPASARRC